MYKLKYFYRRNFVLEQARWILGLFGQWYTDFGQI